MMILRNVALLQATALAVAALPACAADSSRNTYNSTAITPMPESEGRPLFPNADFEFDAQSFDGFAQYGFTDVRGDFVRLTGGTKPPIVPFGAGNGDRVFASYGRGFPGPSQQLAEPLHYRATGSMRSPEFTIDSRYINFAIGGGFLDRSHPHATSVSLWVDGEAVREATGGNRHLTLAWETWDVAEFREKTGYIELLDNHNENGAGGSLPYIAADNFRVADKAATLPMGHPDRPDARIEALFTEPLRPQFHYSAPADWVGDPDDPLFRDGKYHMFYWGHAQSDDLVHWKQLPRAIMNDDRHIAYSGSVVIDEQNTSGLADGAEPPWIALYTGAGAKQVQNLAYSNDGGITFTKYINNPVLDLDLKDFRDPQVFWYEPNRRWIMTIALPLEHKIQFYESANLIDWKLVSEFGPAGSTDAVWEVCDLFPMFLNGNPNTTKWVLVVSVGDASGQYFIGNFDGRSFGIDARFESQLTGIQTVVLEPARSPAFWVDYGEDFYAVKSFANDPTSKTGNRIWTA